MNFSPISAEVLHTLLAQEQQALNKLIALLQQEETALVNGAADDIPSIEAEKISLFDSIDNLVRQRIAITSAAGFNSDPVGMQRFLASRIDIAQTCTPLWTDVLGLWQQAREKNRINATVLQMRMQQTERSINALFHAAGITTTYNSDGRVQGSANLGNSLRVD